MIRLTVSAALAVWLIAGPVVPPDTTFSPGRFKAHVAFLSDDLLEGRAAGTRGHEIAARYVASQFALLGVTPGGTGGTYFQTVPLLEAARSGAAATLVVQSPHGTRTFTHGGKVAITGPLAGGTAKVAAPLVFVGYGVTDPALGIDDYQGLDVRGRIAVALSGYPAGMDSEIGAHLQGAQRRTAAAHGAAGVIFIATRTGAKAFPWEQLMRRAGRPLTTWREDDGIPFDPAAGLQASAQIEQSAAASLFDGASRTLAQILDEADRPGGRPRGMPLPVRAAITVSTTVRRYGSPEVIGIIEGAEPRLRDEYVALMAHADHLGVTGTGPGDHINNGALDNAAGVATLIEVARALSGAARRPRRSVLLVANTAEEKGLLGADYFARHPPVPIGQITAAIDLDMPMLLYDFTDVVAYGATHSTLAPVLREAAAAMDVALSPDPMPEQAVFVRSDHYAMAQRGVPAVMLATGMASGGAAAWPDFLAHRYHQPSDDMSQPILWAAGAKFAELNYRIVSALADADSRARWYAGDYFGNLFAPEAPKAGRP